MGSYNLKWPGFSYMPLYYIDKESNNVYHEEKPIPADKDHLAVYHNQYVSLDDVMALFSTRTMINASQQLILLNENVDTNQMFKDDETGELFMHLNTLLAFLIVFPFCPEFQRARSAVLQYLTNYSETTCLQCGFVQRDCKCKWKPGIISKVDTGPVELVGTITDLATSSTQTDVITCPICKDPKAFKEAKHPVLVLPPGQKVNKGEKFSFTMPTRAGVVQMDPIAGLPALLAPDIANVSGGVTVPCTSAAVSSALTPPVSLSSLKVPAMNNLLPGSLPLPPSSLPMSHTAPVLSGMYNPLSWPSPLPPSCGMGMPGNPSHPYLHGMMPPMTSTFPPYPQKTSPATTSNVSLLSPPPAPGTRFPAVGGYRYSSQPAWRSMQKKTPEEIRQEEEIRRKKKGMTKLFKDQFILAKPGKKKKKKKDKEKKQNQEGKPSNENKNDKAGVEGEIEKKNPSDRSPVKDELPKSIEEEKNEDESKTEVAPDSEKDKVSSEVKDEPVSGEVKDETGEGQTEDSKPEVPAVSAAAEDTVAGVTPAKDADDIKPECDEQMSVKASSDDKPDLSDEKKVEEKPHDVAMTNDEKKVATDADAPELNPTSLSQKTDKCDGDIMSAPDADIDHKTITPGGDEPGISSEPGNVKASVEEDKDVLAEGRTNPGEEDKEEAASNEDKNNESVAGHSGIERSVSARETRRASVSSSTEAITEKAAVSLDDEAIAAQALSELFTGGASTAPLPLDEKIPEGDLVESPKKTDPCEKDASPITVSPLKSAELNGEEAGSVNGSMSSGSGLGNLSLLDEIMQTMKEEEKKAGDEKSVTSSSSSKQSEMGAESVATDKVVPQQGTPTSPTKENAESTPIDLTIEKKDSEKGKAESAGVSSTDVKDDEKDDGLAEMNKCEYDGSLIHYSEMEVPSALIKKGYAAFEFVPTGERMIRCVLFGCGQCFDTEEFAKIHVKCHEPKGHGLQCYVCNKFTVPTTKWYNMLRHLQTAHEIALVESDLHCTFCGLKMPDAGKLEEHVYFHHYSQYKCIHCAEQLFTWNHVQHHLTERCPERTKGHFYYSCPYCHFVFHSPQIHQLHIKSHIDEGLVCCICKDNLPWGTWKTLKKHYLSFHMSKDAKKMVKCMKCRMQFSSMDTYTKHVEQRHNKPAAKKPAAKDVAEPPRKKMRRIRRSTAKSDMFDYNDEENFSDSGKEEDDEKEEDDKEKDEKEKDDTSEASPAKETKKEKKKKTKQKEPELEPGEIPPKDLEDKENEETDAKSERAASPEPLPPPPPPPPPEVVLNCDKCSKTFRTQRRLDLHQENAHGEVQCEKCDYVAKNKHMLKSHIQAKHSEKEHACTECSKSFDHFYQLKIHLAAHARNVIYPCKVCKAEFNSSKDLRVHQREEHPDEANKAQQMCMECSFQCYSKTTLKIHMRKKHPELCDDDDSVDHCYFNRKLDPPPPPEPKSRYKRKVETTVSTPNRGRPKNKVKAKAALRKGGRLSKAALREERKRKEREKKERSILDQLKKLRRASCARTRSFDEYQIIRDDDTRRGEINMTIAAGSNQANSTPVRPRTYSPLSYARMRKPSLRESEDDEEFTDIRTGRVNRQNDIDIKPIELDHCYYKTTETVLREMMQSDSFLSDTSDPGAGMSIVNTPDVGEFQDCLTAPVPRVPNPQPSSTMWSNFDSLVDSTPMPNFQVQPPAAPPIMNAPATSSSAQLSTIQPPQSATSFQSPLGHRKVVVQRIHGGDIPESNQGGIYVRKFEKFPKLSIPQIQTQTVSRDPFQCSPDMRIVRLENPGGPRIMRIERVNRPPPDAHPQSNNLSKLVAALSEGEQVVNPPVGVQSPVMSTINSNLNFSSPPLCSFTNTQTVDSFSMSSTPTSQAITNYAPLPPGEDEHNLSSGSHAESLGDFDESNLLMGDADMQDILQQAVQVLQDNSGLDTSFEDMEAVQNIDL